VKKRLQRNKERDKKYRMIKNHAVFNYGPIFYFFALRAACAAASLAIGTRNGEQDT
jgi:hypothetical protein